jgi:hypothetical protein
MRTRVGRSCILCYWLAGLYVVSEGWQELKLSDPEVDALLKSPHVEKLKRFRHGVYHFQPDYFDKRFMDALALGDDFSEWAKSLMLAFARYFDAWIKGQTAALSAFSGAEPAAYLGDAEL